MHPNAPPPILFLIDLSPFAVAPSTTSPSCAVNGRKKAQKTAASICSAIERLLVYSMHGTEFAFQTVGTSASHNIHPVSCSLQCINHKALLSMRQLILKQAAKAADSPSRTSQLSSITSAAESLITATGELSYDSFLDAGKSDDRKTTLVIFSHPPKTEQHFNTFAPSLDETSAPNTCKPRTVISHPHRLNLLWVNYSSICTVPSCFNSWLSDQGARLLSLQSLIIDRRVLPPRVAINSFIRPVRPANQIVQVDFMVSGDPSSTCSHQYGLYFRASLSSIVANSNTLTNVVIIPKHFVTESDDINDDQDMYRAGSFSALPRFISPSPYGSDGDHREPADGENIWAESFAGLMTSLRTSHCRLAVEVYELNNLERVRASYAVISAVTPISASLRLVSPCAVGETETLSFSSTSFSSWESAQRGTSLDIICGGASEGSYLADHTFALLPYWFSGRENNGKMHSEDKESHAISEVIEFKNATPMKRTKTTMINCVRAAVEASKDVQKSSSENEDIRSDLLKMLQDRLEESNLKPVVLPSPSPEPEMIQSLPVLKGTATYVTSTLSDQGTRDQGTGEAIDINKRKTSPGPIQNQLLSISGNDQGSGTPHKPMPSLPTSPLNENSCDPLPNTHAGSEENDAVQESSCRNLPETLDESDCEPDENDTLPVIQGTTNPVITILSDQDVSEAVDINQRKTLIGLNQNQLLPSDANDQGVEFLNKRVPSLPSSPLEEKSCDPLPNIHAGGEENDVLQKSCVHKILPIPSPEPETTWSLPVLHGGTNPMINILRDQGNRQSVNINKRNTSTNPIQHQILSTAGNDQGGASLHKPIPSLPSSPLETPWPLPVLQCVTNPRTTILSDQGTGEAVDINMGKTSSGPILNQLLSISGNNQDGEPLHEPIPSLPSPPLETTWSPPLIKRTANYMTSLLNEGTREAVDIIKRKTSPGPIQNQSLSIPGNDQDVESLFEPIPPVQSSPLNENSCDPLPNIHAGSEENDTVQESSCRNLPETLDESDCEPDENDNLYARAVIDANIGPVSHASCGARDAIDVLSMSTNDHNNTIMMVRNCMDALSWLAQTVMKEGKIKHDVRKAVKKRVRKTDSVCDELQQSRQSGKDVGMVDRDMGVNVWTAVLDAFEQIVWLSAAATFNLRKRSHRKRVKKFGKRVRTIISVVQVTGQLAASKPETKELFDECFTMLFSSILKPFMDGWSDDKPAEWLLELADQFQDTALGCSPKKAQRHDVVAMSTARDAKALARGKAPSRKRSRDFLEDNDMMDSKDSMRKSARRSSRTGSKDKRSRKEHKSLGDLVSQMKEKKVATSIHGRDRFSAVENRLRPGAESATPRLSIRVDLKKTGGKRPSGRRPSQSKAQEKSQQIEKRVNALFENLRQKASKSGDEKSGDENESEYDERVMDKDFVVDESPRASRRFELDESVEEDDEDEIFKCLSSGEDGEDSLEIEYAGSTNSIPVLEEEVEVPETPS